MQQFELWQVMVLAVVQGVTEFIPVSSDGHLALVEPLVWDGSGPRPNGMDLTIVLHVGTLGSILVYYRRLIVRLVGEDWRVAWLMGLGTIPVVVMALICKGVFDEAFEPVLKSTLLTGFM